VDLAFLTSDLPGTGGRIRVRYEDFRVDEVPLYGPVDTGEHLFLRVWKRGIATFEAIRRLAAALDLPERQIGYAGLKDARAVTTQWVSVPAACEPEIAGLEVPRVAVLEVRRHHNKLKIGHLRGNRFRIVVRDARPGCREAAQAVLDRLAGRGVPNYFGQQRFGTRLNGHRCGEAIVRGDYKAFTEHLLGEPSAREHNPDLRRARTLFEQGKVQEAWETMPTRHRIEKKALHALLRFDNDPERAWFAIPKRMRQMFLSSFQSYLFNKVLERRLEELDTVEEGDLAWLHRNGAVFEVVDVEAERARCRTFEISPSGPLFGTQTPHAKGRPGQLEADILAAQGLAEADFDVGGGLSTRGLRRPLRVPLDDARLEPLDESTFALSFLLPAGSFATAVLREVMKTPD